MEFILPPRPKRGASDAEFRRWVMAVLRDIEADLHSLRSCSGVFMHRHGHDPVDITPREIARLERRHARLTEFLRRKTARMGGALASAAVHRAEQDLEAPLRRTA